MLILCLVLFTAIAAGVFYFSREFTLKFNKECEAQFNYRPITLAHTAMAAAPMVLLLLGIAVDNGIGLNVVVSFAILLGSGVAAFKYLQKKMDTPKAKIALLLLLVFGFIAFAVAMVVLLLVLTGKSDDEKDHRTHLHWPDPFNPWQ